MGTPARLPVNSSTADLDINSRPGPQPPDPAKRLGLPEPVFPQYPELLNDPGPSTPPDRRRWGRKCIYRGLKGWLFPYVRSRVLPGEFHPITAYLFVEYKCNLDCWYCWAYNNQVKGMTEDVARSSIDWLHERGCRVLALMGGEPLIRPQFVHKVVYYAAQKGFWVYIATNGRLLRPEVADRLGDAGVAVINLALDAWDVNPSLPKALVSVRKNFEHILRKQFVYGYMVFFNINICRNNTQDVRELTEYAHACHIATDYHINETPMLDQDAHFKHLFDNPTYIRPEDWRDIDALIDWLIEKNRSGYQMVNSVRRLEEMKAFMRMASGADLRKTGWNGDGAVGDGDEAETLASMPGIFRDPSGEFQFAEWGCRAGQNNVVIRSEGSVTPCFPMYSASFDWGNIYEPKFDQKQLKDMKKMCQRHCFSTLNHNLAYCYNDSRVIKWLWTRGVKDKFQGGAHCFDD